MVITLNSESIFGENPGNDFCSSIDFDISTMVRLSKDYFNKSLMTILGLASVLLCENEHTDKMDYCLFRRKYLLGCLGKLGVVT